MINIKSIDEKEVTSFLLEHLRQESESGYTFEEESKMNNSNKNVILKLEYIQNSTFTEQKFKLLVSYNRYDNKLLEFIKAKVSSFHYPSYITEVINEIQYNPYHLGKYLFSINFVLKLPQNKTL